MEIATIIMAICAIISLPISIWAILRSNKAIEISNNIENKYNYGNHDNVIMESRIEKNGGHGVNYGSKN